MPSSEHKLYFFAAFVGVHQLLVCILLALIFYKVCGSERACTKASGQLAGFGERTVPMKEPELALINWKQQQYGNPGIRLSMSGENPYDDNLYTLPGGIFAAYKNAVTHTNKFGGSKQGIGMKPSYLPSRCLRVIAITILSRQSATSR